VDFLLQGVVLSQIANYYGWCKEDKWVFRLAVAFLGFLTFLKSAQTFAIIWIQLIVDYGDLQKVVLLNFTAWWEIAHPLMVAGIGLYVQLYFCFRLWVISKNWVVVAPSLIIFSFAVLAVSRATYYITEAEPIIVGHWFTAYLSAVFAGNVILSVTTTYFLLKVKQNCHPSSVGLISAVVRLTFETAAPATICAMFNLIFAQVYTGNDGIVATAFNIALAKLYAISMMWTLNGRSTIRAQHSSHHGMSNPSSELSHSGTRSRPRRPNPELDLGNIQVLTKTESMRQIDVRNVYGPMDSPSEIRPSENSSYLDIEKGGQESV